MNTALNSQEALKRTKARETSARGRPVMPKVLAIVGVGDADDVACIERARQYAARAGARVGVIAHLDRSRVGAETVELRTLAERLNFQRLGAVTDDIESLLHAIHVAGAETVFVANRRHAHWLGMASHLEWQLARRSPVNVWFVSGDSQHDRLCEAEALVAAIGRTNPQAESGGRGEAEVMSHAARLSHLFGLEVNLAHALRRPPMLVPGPFHDAPDLVEHSRMLDESRPARLAGSKNDLLALADAWHIKEYEVHVRSGEPADVLVDTARDVEAALLLVSADRDEPRIARFARSVSIEPLLESVSCDVLVVRKGTGVEPRITELSVEAA